MKKIIEKIKNPPSEYRPVPFWSWNSELETEETRWQIDEMNKIGMGGFFMHARGGLTTEYLGKDWMDNVKASIDEAKKLGMHAWGYDENGWPSGFGSDAVNGLGIEYQQKYLRMEIADEEKSTDTTITNIKLDDGKVAHFYYDINPFYVDTLNGTVTEEFLKSTHEKYKSELGDSFKNMRGFFTDEPQVSRGGLPWSFILDDEYEKAYGERLIPHLCDLFLDGGDEGKVTRFRFWKLVSYLFSENFMGKIYKWCNENGTELTGHMVLEEGLTDAIESNGAVMPNYEYMHIPGVDKLRLDLNRYLMPSQVTSVCAQLGKKQILTESFAMCGWDVSFEELKHVYEWQMVKGINLLCQHLSPYSLEGLRKRDYPAGHFFQNPWWKDYRDFNDFASRMGMLLSEGEIKCDVLVLHTMSSAWVNWYGDNRERRIKCNSIQKDLFDVMEVLDKNQILFHLGDDKIMNKYAKVEGDKFTVGKITYSTVIVPSSECMDRGTFELLKAFKENGGNLIFVQNVPELIDGMASKEADEICDTHADKPEDILMFLPQSAECCNISDINGESVDIQVCRRIFDDFEMFYFVNSFSDKVDTKINLIGKSAAMFDYMTGETVPVTFTEKDGVITINHTFEKMGSVVYFVRQDELYKSAEDNKQELTSINDKLRGRWEITRSDDNLLTLDYCDVYFNGELVRKHEYILTVQELACDLKKKVKIAMDFDVELDRNIPDRISLVLERPEQYTVYVNGKVVDKTDMGYYRDKSFRMIDITGKLEKGYNIITLECDFVQSEKVYGYLENCVKFESVKNKLYYDMEIEPIYLLGEFAVNSSEDFEPCSGEGLITGGKFSLTKRPFHVDDGDIAPQGFPFFCGSMTLKKTITLSEDEIHNRSIEFSRLPSIVTKISVNGKVLPNLCWAPYTYDLSGLLNVGDNEIEIELITSFRNMLGPHHLGKNAKVAYPATFQKESRIWASKACTDIWQNDTYSFSGIGIYLK